MIYPLKFQPIYKERIWGGTLLREVFGRETPAGKRIGESWELTDLPEDPRQKNAGAGKSVISNGPFAGQTLESVVRKYPEEITGSKQPGQFPLLIKLLDCGDVLSVQVHPDEETCKRMGKGDFKAECWYIVRANPKAVIYKGFREGVTKESFLNAVKEGAVEQTLRKIEVVAGQCFYVPAGIPHALGPGLLIAEIQTPSDTTFRVFDWNRVDETGNPRALHINEAIESIHFGRQDYKFSATTTGRLIDSRFFKVDKEQHKPDSEVLVSNGQMKILIFLTGSGTIAGPNYMVDFKPGETLLIPAAYTGNMRFTAETECLAVTT